MFVFPTTNFDSGHRYFELPIAISFRLSHSNQLYPSHASNCGHGGVYVNKSDVELSLGENPNRAIELSIQSFTRLSSCRGVSHYYALFLGLTADKVVLVVRPQQSSIVSTKYLVDPEAW